VLPLTVGLSNAHGELIHLNRRVVETTGYTFEDHVFRDALVKYVHPDDLPRMFEVCAHGYTQKASFEFEQRQLRKDNQYHWILVQMAPILDEEGQIIRWCSTSTDIQQLKQAEEKLRQSEADLLEAQRISHTGSWKHNLESGLVTITPEMARMFGVSEDQKSITADAFFGRLDPEDRHSQAISYQQAILTKADFESDYRIVLPDGSMMHVHNIGHPKFNESGDLMEFVGTVLDVTAAKEAEEKIRQSEREARQLIDLSPLHITLLGTDGGRIYNNRAALDYYGLALEAWQAADFQRLFHPVDAELATSEVPGKLRGDSPFEYEARLKRSDGQYRWFHYRCNPMLDEQERITRWYCAGTDIHDRKAAEQRLQDENVSLREEVDKASMFEEIVGGSASLKKVLSRISRVAPTDSSVLITGETGTGKELVARAIHRRSQRYSHPFVSVNCAVIPRDLIASELFGHEKGAFTGATQRRLGRFELAEKGTIFLDEAGELPAETQIALLRVLQEHEFERVGGSGSIRTDVRVIAATNRDLESAIESGKFRSDLFYRLNVFPVELPPLRERREDIPLLVTYFLNRYARKAGRHFTAVDKKSLDLLQSYAWPGNIRELQNVIERSVIVSETEIFSVDESWLSRRPSSPDTSIQPNLFNRLPDQEKTLIEAALRECGGRVYGPSGAAARLGMPRTTLETKIRALKINKHRFKGD
jgi:PAS domain S-box-containing protein